MATIEYEVTVSEQSDGAIYFDAQEEAECRAALAALALVPWAAIAMLSAAHAAGDAWVTYSQQFSAWEALGGVWATDGSHRKDAIWISTLEPALEAWQRASEAMRIAATGYAKAAKS